MPKNSKERLLAEIQRELDGIQRNMKHELGLHPENAVAICIEVRRKLKALSIQTAPKN